MRLTVRATQHVVSFNFTDGDLLEGSHLHLELDLSPGIYHLLIEISDTFPELHPDDALLARRRQTLHVPQDLVSTQKLVRGGSNRNILLLEISSKSLTM